MADVKYYKDFEPRRYLRFASVIFGMATLAFIGLSLIQSRVGYQFGISGYRFIGCQLQASSNPLGSTCGYFLHNVSISLIAWLGGFAVVGPFYIVWENAQNIGSYIGQAITGGSNTFGSGGEALLFLLPHGIIEIPAILLSISLGVYIANVVIEQRKKLIEYDFTKIIWETLPWYLLVVGMLGVAAFIEANISLRFAQAAGGFF